MASITVTAAVTSSVTGSPEQNHRSGAVGTSSALENQLGDQLNNSHVKRQGDIEQASAPIPYHQKLLDEDESTTYTINGKSFNVSRRYEPVKTIGTGAYGTVVAADDLWTGDKVAIKQVADVFYDLVDAKRVLREIRLMQHFNHPNVLDLRDMIPPVSLSKFEDVYLISDFMGTDLHRVIYSAQKLSVNHIQYICCQLLSALKHIHSAGVIHRDIKPQNILINAECEVKLCDFGLARSVHEEGELTEYVVTRWYRPPEVLFAIPDYGPEVDLWGVGCILAELFLKRPLFPADGYLQMVRLICLVLGKPTKDDSSFIRSERGLRFLENVQYEEANRYKLEKRLEDRTVPEDAYNLLRKLLQFNPTHRISVSEALSHPFLCEYASSDDDIIAEEFLFREDNVVLNKPMLQELMFKEIAKFDDRAKSVLIAADKRGELRFPLEEGEL